jgi:hypothetical protein
MLWDSKLWCFNPTLETHFSCNYEFLFFLCVQTFSSSNFLFFAKIKIPQATAFLIIASVLKNQSYKTTQALSVCCRLVSRGVLNQHDLIGDTFQLKLSVLFLSLCSNFYLFNVYVFRKD